MLEVFSKVYIKNIYEPWIIIIIIFLMMIKCKHYKFEIKGKIRY